jgi:hypothetical protein
LPRPALTGLAPFGTVEVRAAEHIEGFLPVALELSTTLRLAARSFLALALRGGFPALTFNLLLALAVCVQLIAGRSVA